MTSEAGLSKALWPLLCFVFFFWITHSGGNQLPHNADIQADLWRGSHGEELRILPTVCEEALLEAEPPAPVKPSDDCSLS